MNPAPYLVERDLGTVKYLEYQLPISLKGVVVWRDRIPLLRNLRDEWELPGGKLELDEEPRECLRREIDEELSWPVTVGEPVHAWVHRVQPDRHVFMMIYAARYDGDRPPVCSAEHKEIRLLSFEQALAESVNLPAGCRTAVRMVAASRPDTRMLAAGRALGADTDRVVTWPIRPGRHAPPPAPPPA